MHFKISNESKLLLSPNSIYAGQMMKRVILPHRRGCYEGDGKVKGCNTCQYTCSIMDKKQLLAVAAVDNRQ